VSDGVTIIVAVPAYAYIMLAVGWIAWFLPFPLNKWNFAAPERRNNRARWGLALQVCHCMLIGRSMNGSVA